VGDEGLYASLDMAPLWSMLFVAKAFEAIARTAYSRGLFITSRPLEVEGDVRTIGAGAMLSEGRGGSLSPMILDAFSGT